MARQSSASDRAQARVVGQEPRGLSYEREPQRPDEAVDTRGSSEAPSGPADMGGRDHPLAPEQVYERDVPQAAGVGPDPAPRPDAYGSEWGQTPLPVQEPTATARGARTGALSILGVVLIALIVVFVVILVRA